MISSGKRYVSIVSGAARGIGFGIAEALSQRGDRLILGDLLFPESPADSEYAGKFTEKAILMKTDITRVDSVECLVAAALKKYGRIDCLVNSAGINRTASVQEMSDADWNSVIAVNLTGAFLLSRVVSRVMIEQEYGRIVHIGSTASHTAAAGLSAYAASKHGLIGLVRGMACDLARYGITVNAVCPGNNETEMLDIIIAERAKNQGVTPEEIRREIIKKTPAGRIGRPKDIATAALFLTSREAEYITGQMLTVDGGRSLNLI